MRRVAPFFSRSLGRGRGVAHERSRSGMKQGVPASLEQESDDIATAPVAHLYWAGGA